MHTRLVRVYSHPRLLVGYIGSEGAKDVKSNKKLKKSFNFFRGQLPDFEPDSMASHVVHLTNEVNAHTKNKVEFC